MKQILTLAALALGTASTVNAAVILPQALLPAHAVADVTDTADAVDLDLVADYFACAELAEIRMLTASESAACATLYTKVKLAFLPQIGETEYEAMSAADRATANLRGYEAYREWRAANPDLVEEMEADARARIVAPGS